MTPTSPRQEFIFENGHRVGKLAQGLFPGGTEIEHDGQNFGGMITSFTRRPSKAATF
jgi:hypothetical protein